MSASEDLSPPRLYDVISGVGNNELKGLVFGLMRNEVSYTASPLHAKTIAMQGEDPAWHVSTQTPFSYCETFTNVGVVAKSTAEPLAYRINEVGKKLALPLLGHLLDVSLNEEQSLAAFHGPTQTNADSAIRPSQRRIEIMRAMRDSDGAKTPMANIASKLSTKVHAAGEIAQDLAAVNIIERESSGRGKPTVSYLAEPGLADVKLRQDVGSQLLFDVAAVLKEHFKNSQDPITNADIASALISNYGYDEGKTALIKKVSNKTHQLSHVRKVLKSVREVEGSNVREAIWATDEQLATINNLLQVIDGMQNPTAKYLSEGREKIEVILSDPDIVNHLVAKARKDSAGLKRLPEGQQQNINAVKSLLFSSPGALSIRDIQDKLLEQGHNLDRATIRQYTGLFVNLGRIAVQPTSEGDKYLPILE
jgi:hypothetical protein